MSCRDRAGNSGALVHLFEVTRDKRVVWQFYNKTDRQFRTVASAQLLDVEESLVSGVPLR